VVVNEFAVSSIWNDSSLRLVLLVRFFAELGKSKFVRNNYFLSSGELILGSSESFDNVGFVDFFASYGEQDLFNINTSYSSTRLSKGSSHTSLESISTSTRKHFVDSQYVPRVNSYSHMEGIFSSHLGNVFVSADTSSFQSFRGEILSFQRYQVDTCWEIVNISSLSSKIVDSDLCIGDTSTVSGFDVGFSRIKTIASGWSSTHDDGWLMDEIVAMRNKKPRRAEGGRVAEQIRADQ